MNHSDMLKDLLNAVSTGETNVDDALGALRDMPFRDIGHTKIDGHRALRNGFPEVIYAEGKTPEQVGDIIGHMRERANILATRVSPETAAHVQDRFPDVDYNTMGRTLTYVKDAIAYRTGTVGIITAGTSDLGVAEEARVTSEMLGNRADIISDVGVAGIHRLFHTMDNLRRYTVLIVIAGMEGALSSVVGGLVDQPLIAVPTSVGYGANFSGLSALLGMLTSCASGVTVVNIDNGFGAACAALRINKLVG